MAGEKRKRVSGAVEKNSSSSSSSKRVAFEPPSVLKVRHVDIDTGLHPCVVTCPGIEAPQITFDAFTKSHTQKHALSKTIKPSTHSVILHSSEHPRLDYTASTSTTEGHLTHYLAILDPATNQIQVIPAHHLTLRSTLRSEVRDLEEQDRRSYMQQREALGREFGTKRAQKAIDSRTTNAITNTELDGEGQMTDVQSAILQTVADATAGDATKAEQEETLLDSKPIPKPNLAAETLESVYPLSTLLPPTDHRLVPIKEWQENARNEVEMELNHRTVAFRVSEIGKSDDNDKLKALAYLYLLLDFNRVLGHAGRSGSKGIPKPEILTKRLAAWPYQLVDSVRHRFADSTGRTLSKWHVDKLYTHMCALLLYLDDWKTDIGNLKDDLKLDIKEMSRYFLELGCKVTKPTDAETKAWSQKQRGAATRTARLKLPLEFPRVRAGRRT